MVSNLEERVMKPKALPASPVLVTGANGFIGSGLCKALLQAGCSVRGLILKGTDPSNLELLGVPYQEGDICRPESLHQALAGVKTVFHLAAMVKDWGRYSDFITVNAGGTKNMLQASCDAGAKRFVHMSSLAIHRFTGHVDGDENAPGNNRAFGYCASKIHAEREVRQFQEQGRIETTIIRPGGIIWGPGDTTTFIHLAEAMEKGKLPLVGGGSQLFCYSYVENLVAGMILAAAEPAGAGETFILTDDLKMSLKEGLQTLSEVLQVPVRFLRIPSSVAWGAAWLLEGLWRMARAKNPPLVHRYRVGIVARDFHFSCDKAKRVLGYHPTISFEEGLRRTVAWYRSWKEGSGKLRSDNGKNPGVEGG